MADKTYAKRLTPSGNSYSKAFAAAKAAGKETFMWKGKDYTTETAEERKADFKKETRKEQFQRKEKTGEGGGLTGAMTGAQLATRDAQGNVVTPDVVAGSYMSPYQSDVMSTALTEFD